jgi:hypothetical protein
VALNGTDEADLEEFLSLSHPERDGRIFLVTKATHARILDLHTDVGRLVAALTRQTVAVDRNTAAIEVAFAGAVRKLKSIPPPREKLPSILDDKEEDTTAIRHLKEQVAPIVESYAAASAVQEADARRLRTLAMALGMVVALAAVAGIIWAVFRFAVHAT